MKKYKRGISIVEVVVSMAMILLISLAAFSAYFACTTVISNAQNTTKLISYSQTLAHCFSDSVNEDSDLLSSFNSKVEFSFGNEVSLIKIGNLTDENGILYDFTFDCGNVNFYITESDFTYEINIISYALNSNNPIYEYSRSYKIV